MALFKPKEKLKRFDEFNPLIYKDRGFKAVFLDIDNTIAIPDTGSLTDEAIAFLNKIKEANMIPVIFSNNNQKRVADFVKGYDVLYTYKSYKPLPFAYWRTCNQLNIKPKNVICIGDQLLTDILGANLAGSYGIYSKQLVEHDIPVTARNRKIEKFIWRHILHEEV